MAPKKQEELTVVSSEPVDFDDKKEVKEEKEEEKKEEEKKEEEKKEEKEEKKGEESKAINDDKEELKETPPALPPKPTEEKVDEVPINDEVPPPAPPPRPLSPASQLTKTLKEAFPNIEDKLITAVIIASQGNLDPAFNALLYISDPSFKPTIEVNAQPINEKSKPDSTLTDDELLARQLQKEFEKEDRKRRQKHQERQRRSNQQQQQRRYDDDDESPDEFDQIKESFTQGIEEARSTLNGWVSGFSKKFQGANDNENQSKPQLFGALGGSSFKNNNQNNNQNRNQNKFDEDPEILSSDFHNRINLSNNDDSAPSLPNRNKEQNVTRGNKWQPLNSDVPINSDAFLVTDSEDEDTGVSNYDTKNKK